MRILVTGAGSGVGRATSALLAGRGHEVVASARDEKTLAGLEVALRLRLDVRDAASVDAARRELGFVDALVNNAAIAVDGPIERVDMARVEEMFETNVFGPARTIQAFVPAMRERGGGVVVNVSSVAGRVAQPLDGYYSATKHALEAISEALYVEMAHFGVRVVIVEPGFISPGMNSHHSPGLAGPYAELEAQLGQLAEKMRAGAPPGPGAVAEVIADAIENPGGPLRRRVGADAELILSARGSLGDDEFETAMREVVGLTW
jgi:NAD(P)-dependent dehydrogenase (short-subunit alcohol dehydrogenase family)